MRLLNSIHNSRSTPGFLVNSMPKAGTHLLVKAVNMFPGINRSRIRIRDHMVGAIREVDELADEMLLIGVGWPRPVNMQLIRRELSRIGFGHYAQIHANYSDQLLTLLMEFGLRMLLILRDPRDIVISHAKYTVRHEHHFLFDYSKSLSESERIMMSIIGLEHKTHSSPRLLNISERYAGLLEWIDKPVNYTTFFEKMVGPQGGGTREMQVSELINISEHLGVRCSTGDIEKMADRLFGGTNTFRKGLIGNWRNYFSNEHKQVFKEIAGQLLIDLGYEQNYNW